MVCKRKERSPCVCGALLTLLSLALPHCQTNTLLVSGTAAAAFVPPSSIRSPPRDAWHRFQVVNSCLCVLLIPSLPPSVSVSAPGNLECVSFAVRLLVLASRAAAVVTFEICRLQQARRGEQEAGFKFRRPWSIKAGVSLRSISGGSDFTKSVAVFPPSSHSRKKPTTTTRIYLTHIQMTH